MGQKSFREPSGVVFLGYRVNFTVFDGSYTMGACQWVNMQWVCIAEQHPSKVNPVYRLTSTLTTPPHREGGKRVLLGC